MCRLTRMAWTFRMVAKRMNDVGRVGSLFSRRPNPVQRRLGGNSLALLPSPRGLGRCHPRAVLVPLGKPLATQVAERRVDESSRVVVPLAVKSCHDFSHGQRLASIVQDAAQNRCAGLTVWGVRDTTASFRCATSFRFPGVISRPSRSASIRGWRHGLR